LNPKQVDFFRATTKYTLFGGAKGGGKSHVTDRLAIYDAITYPGISMLMLRATFEDVRKNHIEPILKILPPTVHSYNGSTHQLTFWNGSTLQFGNWSGMESERKYQGQSYDIIFIDEASQFTERMFRHLCGCLRGNVGKGFPKRIYLTANPGGVGHQFLKRLFFDRRFHVDLENPELTEKPEDYGFIFAKAEDNVAMLKENPDYLADIAKMSESAAMRYGDWNIASGLFFSAFKLDVHTFKPFKVPTHWKLYRSFDYGLDMLACFWWAIDTDGRAWCIRSLEKPDLNVQEAAGAILEHTLPNEDISVTFAPPDMFSRQRDTGRTIAETMMSCGVEIVKADNNRVQGHLLMRSMLEPIPLHDEFVIKKFGSKDKAPKELPALMFFDNVGGVLEDIQAIQTDEANPNDCAKQPHDLTHTIDGVRYFCVSRSMPGEVVKPKEERYDPLAEFHEEAMDFESVICGGEPSASWLGG